MAAPPLPQLAGVEHRHVRVGPRRVHVAFAGPEDGPVAYLHHGWPQHWFQFRHLIGPLADAGLRVVAPDTRGFGWSDPPPDPDYRKETLAGDVPALCAELGIERIRFVGHDWGGWSGFLLALRRPDLIERAVVMSIPPPWVRPDRLSPAVLKALPYYQLPLAAPLPARLQVLAYRQALRQGRVAGSWEPAILETYLAPLRAAAQRRATRALYRTFLTRELVPLARGAYDGLRLTVPILYLMGAREPLLQEGTLERFHARADHGESDLVPGAGHFLPEEAPDAVAERVVPFLS